ncbi:MAG TPA: glycoside hydrolase family 97 catalytic domain-containing protein, partial [Rhodothermales bacterium]|nr:glycoside hydrolase family 97 catalytic domain-containing protein [Rhodothermales bacterium]
MRRLFPLVCLLLAPALYAQDTTLMLRSPGRVLTLTVRLKGGTPSYELARLGRPVVLDSKLGMMLRESRMAGGLPMDWGLSLAAADTSSFDETWEQPWGEVRRIRNRYRQLRVGLRTNQPPQRHLDVVFRLYDDGLGFRYEWPEQAALDSFEVMDEATEFRFAGDPEAWWTPAYQDNHYEFLYTRSPISQVPPAHTPLTLETQDGLAVSIHEAALVDFPAMQLVHTGIGALRADLAPWGTGVKAYGRTPYRSSWRTIAVNDSPASLATNYLVLNLNEPSRLPDVSWIEPGKYVGVWWAMHLDKYSWAPGPKHGAHTDTVRKYIDFAARHGFKGVLVEGWNEGWDQAWYNGEGYRFNFTKPYPDFDAAGLSRYARDRGVRLIGHHETGAIVDNYERQMDDAYAWAAAHGMNAVKTGYVGNRLRTTTGLAEWHYGQFAARHYQASVESAARHRIMLDVHEPIKDTGLRRTWPNLMTREGMRGMEYDAWSGDGGNPPEHHTVLPFTRNLVAPFDYTPGVLDLFYPEHKPRNRVNMTLAKALALYVTIYSPLHMVADLPENLEGHPA